MTIPSRKPGLDFLSTMPILTGLEFLSSIIFHFPFHCSCNISSHLLS